MAVPPSEIENIREGTYLGEINHEFCLEHIKSPLKAGSPGLSMYSNTFDTRYVDFSIQNNY